MDTSALPHTSALHLHSIMFLFQCNVCIQSQYHVLKFTFHYVSISMLTGNAVSSKDIHLHSIMFLFQWRPSGSMASSLIIYIPLCFYFNLHLKRIAVEHIIIYIPLCFYFNSVCVAGLTPISPFTFHYVSISIHTQTLAQRLTVIYIPLCFYFNKYDTKPPTLYLSHLHSIMFLFQYLISACNAVAQFNLHSIMFLFQSDSSAFCSALALFTFHYVSISIYTGCVIF